MKVIHKHSFENIDMVGHGSRRTLSMALNAEIIKVGVQDNIICIWEEHFTTNESIKIDRHFWIIGTGFPEVPNTMIHCDTLIHSPWVWHLYEDIF